MAEFKAFKNNKYLENSYYKIPQELSQKNHWIDENNNIFLIFTRQELESQI